MYLRAPASIVYPNYLEGFSLLLNWLAPIDMSIVEKYDYGISSDIPRLHCNWELNTMAKLLGIHPKILYRIYTFEMLYKSNEDTPEEFW